MKLEEPIREALKAIEKLQFRLEKTETGARVATKPLQRKKQKVNDRIEFFLADRRVRPRAGQDGA